MIWFILKNIIFPGDSTYYFSSTSEEQRPKVIKGFCWRLPIYKRVESNLNLGSSTSEMHAFCVILPWLWTKDIMPDTVGDIKWSDRSLWPCQRNHKLTWEMGCIHRAITKARGHDGLQWPGKQDERAKQVHKHRIDIDIRGEVEGGTKDFSYVHLSTHNMLDV